MEWNEKTIESKESQGENTMSNKKGSAPPRYARG